MPYGITYMWNIKYDTNGTMKQKQTHKENKLAVTGGEERWEKDGLGVWD